MGNFAELVASVSWLSTMLGLVVLIIGGFTGAVQIRLGLNWDTAGRFRILAPGP